MCACYREFKKQENLGNARDPYLGRCHGKGKNFHVIQGKTIKW